MRLSPGDATPNDQTPGGQDGAAAELAARQIFGLTSLLQLQKRARSAKTELELSFLIVNDTFTLVRYRQALLWRRETRGEGSIVAASGLSSADADSPYARFARAVLTLRDPGTAASFSAPDLPGDLTREWPEYLPEHGYWLPLVAPDGRQLGGVLLAREEPWQDSERLLLDNLAEAYAHAWGALLGRRRGWRLGRLTALRTLAVVAVALALLILVPVRLTALAPAEAVPLDPTVVRAPFGGVVDKFMVTPNQRVEKDQPLFSLDPVLLRNRLDVAKAQLVSADAELRQASQQAMFDDKAKTQLAILQGKRDQQAVEVAYVQSLLDRIVVRAPRAGLAVFADINDWIGRPLTQGEKVLIVADPRDVELEIKLPVANAIAMNVGDPVSLFLNVDPERALSGTVRQVAYQPEVGPDGIAAYRLKASLEPTGQPVRIGLQGTAKIYGARTTLFYYLFRRPLATLRQSLGF